MMDKGGRIGAGAMAAATSQRRPLEPLSGQDQQLMDYMDFLERHKTGRRAIHIHLSKLQPQNRRDQNLRIAVATFEDLVKQHDGQIFLLSNGDMVFVAKVGTAADIDAAVNRVRFLFSEDPLAQYDITEAGQFCTWYALETQYQTFYQVVKRLHADADAKRRAAAQAAAAAGDKGASRTRHPLEPALLGKLETLLSRTDLSNLMRRQPVVAVTPSGSVQPVFRELFISIADLQNTVVPDVDLFSDQWLFQRLTQTLDRRMLSLMTRNDDATLSSAFSLNLNVSTILSPEFLAFDKAVKSTSRNSVLIEMQKIDIFADLGAFMFARDFLRERGYKICLDGLNFLMLGFIDREKLGLDLLKVMFSPEMTIDQVGKGRHLMREYVDRCGRARIILSRVEDDVQLQFGHSMGITLFQGRHLDSLVGPARSTPAAFGSARR